MQLAILHHHLNRGGVTRVVENHLRALASAAPNLRPERVVLLHGGRCQDWPAEELEKIAAFPLQQRTVEGFDYDLTGAAAGPALGEHLASALDESGLSSSDTILHWHNHSLGKNASTPLAVAALAKAGYRTLLQIHDFAEDFRPSNYRHLRRKLGDQHGAALPEILYPQAPGIHYAVLNGRDRGVLLRAGVAPERVHFLPNPVAAPPVGSDGARARAAVNSALGLENSRQLLVYPVRGIRRKNLGETLLWSVVAEDAYCLVTLAPQNPQERASFDRWAQLASEFDLPCRLGAPRQLEFGQLLAASQALLTTSVAEGFGMTFLEAWLADRILLGRNLPEITADFTARQIDLESLYDAVLTPVAWIDGRQFIEEMAELIRETYEAFAMEPPSAGDLEQQLDLLLAADTIDFARLPFSQQAAVIARAAGSDDARRQLGDLNPKMSIPSHDWTPIVTANCQAVAAEFALDRLGETLTECYAALLHGEPTSEIVPLSQHDAVLDAFLSIERFHPVRVEK